MAPFIMFASIAGFIAFIVMGIKAIIWKTRYKVLDLPIKDVIETVTTSIEKGKQVEHRSYDYILEVEEAGETKEITLHLNEDKPRMVDSLTVFYRDTAHFAIHRNLAEYVLAPLVVSVVCAIVLLFLAKMYS